MNNAFTSAQRLRFAQQYRKLAASNSVPTLEAEQVAQEIISGARDARLATLITDARNAQTSMNPGPAILEALLGMLHTLPGPVAPQLPLPPTMLPPAFPGLPYIDSNNAQMARAPGTLAASPLFPIAPHVTSQRIQYPGDSAHHQSAQASGRQGNAKFSYSSNTISGNWSNYPLVPATAPAVPALPPPQAFQRQPTSKVFGSVPSTPIPQVGAPVLPRGPTPISAAHPSRQSHRETNSAPQNARLHELFERQLNEEGTSSGPMGFDATGHGASLYDDELHDDAFPAADFLDDDLDENTIYPDEDTAHELHEAGGDYDGSDYGILEDDGLVHDSHNDGDNDDSGVLYLGK